MSVGDTPSGCSVVDRVRADRWLVRCSSVRSMSQGPGWGRGWSCTRRSGSTGSATRCRSGRWRRSTGCIGARCGRRSPRRSRRRARARRGARWCSTRCARWSTRCWSRTWPRRASSATPPGGSSSGCAPSTTRGCRTPMSRSTCTAAARSWWREAAARDAARAGVVAGFVPQCHPPGAEAEVDFADLWVRLDGQMTKCFLFTLRLSHSGRAVHRVFASQGQEAFLEGHVAAFEILGGVPTRQIRYDNLRSAVHRVLFGRNRSESGALVDLPRALRVRGVLLPARQGRRAREGRGGRRRWPVPPHPPGPGARGRHAGRAQRPAGRRGRWPRTTGASTGEPSRWGRRSPSRRRCCCALPAERFDTALSLTARVDRYAQIMVRQCRYSVPARLIGSRVRVALSASRAGGVRRRRRGSRPIPGCSPAASAASSWITTWRSCSASPARCPGRPRLPRPARRDGSPRRTRRSGPPPATGTATPPAPGR